MAQTEPTHDNNAKFLLACFGCLILVVFAFACLGVAGVAAYILLGEADGGFDRAVTAVASVTPTARRPLLIEASATPRPMDTAPPPLPDATMTNTAVPPPGSPTPTPLPINPPAGVLQEPIPAWAYADLERFFNAEYPPHDYFAAANRLGKYNLTARTITAAPYQVGDSRIFYTGSGSLEATLVAATTHAYFWVENGLDLEETAVIAAANKLENEYYPLLVALFGQEWQPGIDNDPRFSVLHLRLPAAAVELGFFSSIDEYPRTLYYDSNEQEMVYLNMSELVIGDELYEGTLVHEIQHLIQWHMDANEAGWLNEGLSQLAELYVGLQTATTAAYLEQPDIRLNTWNYDEDVIDAHYAGAYLFSVYLWEQLGETAVQELSRHPANGMAAVRAVLQGYSDLTLEQFFANWAAANYLDNDAAGPAYIYNTLDLITPAMQEQVSQLPHSHTADLNQYGVHYIDLDVTGPITISFAGDTLVNLVDAPPPDSDRLWLAPSLDDTNAHLTFPFDLTDVAQATLAFDVWYDLEEDWDYAYVAISLDEGETWDLLRAESHTAGEYGPAWNGRSATNLTTANGWISEAISLNQYVGRSLLVRFELLTDSAINGQGFAVANVRVPELGVFAAWGTAVTHWQAQGFVQTGWQLPQQWQVQFIHLGSALAVEPLPLNDRNQGQWRVKLGRAGGILVITPLTPFTNHPGAYWLDVIR